MTDVAFLNDLRRLADSAMEVVSPTAAREVKFLRLSPRELSDLLDAIDQRDRAVELLRRVERCVQGKLGPNWLAERDAILAEVDATNPEGS